MTLVQLFKNNFEDIQYFQGLFHHVKWIQNCATGNKVFEALDMMDNWESTIVKLMPMKSTIYMDQLNIYVNREFFFLNYLKNSGFCPIVKKYYQSPTSCHVIMKKLPDNWVNFANIVHQIKDDKIIWQICRNIIKVVIGMNKLGVFYMDIKPANIMINKETLDIKFIDFEDVLYSTNDINPNNFGLVGTPGFCPPEIYSNQPYNVRKYQSFNIGSLMYYCLESRVPFNNVPQTIALSFQFSKTISNTARRLITFCFSKNIDNRPSLEDIIQYNWIVKEPIRYIPSKYNHIYYQNNYIGT